LFIGNYMIKCLIDWYLGRRCLRRCESVASSKHTKSRHPATPSPFTLATTSSASHNLLCSFITISFSLTVSGLPFSCLPFSQGSFTRNPISRFICFSMCFSSNPFFHRSSFRHILYYTLDNIFSTLWTRIIIL
jgi:hypothetical protein